MMVFFSSMQTTVAKEFMKQPSFKAITKIPKLYIKLFYSVNSAMTECRSENNNLV